MIGIVRRESQILPSSARWISFFRRKKREAEKEADNLAVTTEALELPRAETRSEEEIMRVRDRSGLSTRWKEMMTSSLTEPVKFTKLHDYRESRVRRHYAKYGKQSGLKPGICWPTGQKLRFMEGYEKRFHPSLDKLFGDLKKEKEEAAAERKAREDQIAAKLSKLPKAIEAFHAKMDEKKQLEKEAILKKEKLVQSVREFLGYDIDPKDARFSEALAKIEEEAKLQKKTKKKEALHARMLANLAAMGAEVKTNEEEDGGGKDEKKE